MTETKDYYGRVYLCYEESNNKPLNTYGPIVGFYCHRYYSFKDADAGWWEDRTELHKQDIRHTMIPICKWVPPFLDKYILNWKLKNMYWKGNIWLKQGRNRYSGKKY
jgi:hypothetical protein